jgi:hypothetical protein
MSEGWSWSWQSGWSRSEASSQASSGHEAERGGWRWDQNDAETENDDSWWAEQSWQQEEQQQPKHPPTGKAAKEKRRQQRSEQAGRNQLRVAMNVQVSPAPLSEQIRHERLVKSRMELHQRLLPEVIEEVQNFNVAKSMFGRYCEDRAKAVAEGRPYVALPPPREPWLTVPKAACANQAAEAVSMYAAKAIPIGASRPCHIRPPPASASASVQSRAPFIPKTPPTPPHM